MQKVAFVWTVTLYIVINMNEGRTLDVTEDACL